MLVCVSVVVYVPVSVPVPNVHLIGTAAMHVDFRPPAAKD
jgi:hypothetical protein